MVYETLLVIDKALTSLDFDALRQQAENVDQAPGPGSFPSARTWRSWRARGIFCLRHPEHAWSREIAHIVDQLTR